MAKPSGANQHKDRSHDATDPPKLSDMGLTKDMSSRAQAIANVPEDEFEDVDNMTFDEIAKIFVITRARVIQMYQAETKCN